MFTMSFHRNKMLPSRSSAFYPIFYIFHNSRTTEFLSVCKLKCSQCVNQSHMEQSLPLSKWTVDTQGGKCLIPMYSVKTRCNVGDFASENGKQFLISSTACIAIQGNRAQLGHDPSDQCRGEYELNLGSLVRWQHPRLGTFALVCSHSVYVSMQTRGEKCCYLYFIPNTKTVSVWDLHLPVYKLSLMHHTSASGSTSTTVFTDSTYTLHSLLLWFLLQESDLDIIRYCKSTELLNWWSISADRFQVRKSLSMRTVLSLQSYCDVVGWVITTDSLKKTASIRKEPKSQHMKWNI